MFISYSNHIRCFIILSLFQHRCTLHIACKMIFRSRTYVRCLWISGQSRLATCASPWGVLVANTASILGEAALSTWKCRCDMEWSGYPLQQQQHGIIQPLTVDSTKFTFVIQGMKSRDLGEKNISKSSIWLNRVCAMRWGWNSGCIIVRYEWQLHVDHECLRTLVDRPLESWSRHGWVVFYSAFPRTRPTFQRHYRWQHLWVWFFFFFV